MLSLYRLPGRPPGHGIDAGSRAEETFTQHQPTRGGNMSRVWGNTLAAMALALGAQSVAAQAVNGCPAGQAMQSSDPSGRNITCVPIGDGAALQAEIAARRAGDENILSMLGQLTEANIVGRWAMSGTTSCLQSSTGFTAVNMSPVIPATGSAFVTQLSGTIIGTRTFNADGTGRSVATSHSMSFPGTFHGAAPGFVGVGTFVGGASVATLDAGFTWSIQSDGTLLINDDNTIPQPFTAPPFRVGSTVTIENVPSFVGHISKDKKTILLTHSEMAVETSVLRNSSGTVTNTTPRFCARHRVLTRLAD